MKLPFLQKGIITFQTILIVASPIFAVVGAYYTGILNTNQAISQTKEELVDKISANEIKTAENKKDIDNINGKLEKIDNKLDRLIELQLK
jgi:hypothetical protein